MDVFALLFIVSFLALIFTLVVMHIRKCVNKGKGDIAVEEEVKTAVEKLFTYTTMSFWKRLVFLFTGKVN